MSTSDPVAWLLRPKVQRYPQKPMISGVMTTRPTPENLEFAELDGDEYVPLYAAPKPPDEDFARLIAEMETFSPEAMAEARAWAKAELPGMLANANISDVWIVEPKREPLTEAQIDDLIRAEHFRRWSKTPPEPVSLAKFARVVEAAHGIKGSAA